MIALTPWQYRSHINLNLGWPPMSQLHSINQNTPTTSPAPMRHITLSASTYQFKLTWPFWTFLVLKPIVGMVLGNKIRVSSYTHRHRSITLEHHRPSQLGDILDRELSSLQRNHHFVSIRPSNSGSCQGDRALSPLRPGAKTTCRRSADRSWSRPSRSPWKVSVKKKSGRKVEALTSLVRSTSMVSTYQNFLSNQS